MTEIARLDKEAAKSAPERFFSNPQALVEEIMLTRGEKIATLERWRQKLLRLLAESEQRRSVDGGTGRRHARTLGEIELARRLLRRPQES